MSAKRKAEMKLFEALKTIPLSSIESERTFSVTGFCITKFGCSLGHLVFLKHIFQKEEQEEKDRIEKVRLERIELLHQQAK